ncbi:YqhG family protein [Paenibacillus sp. NEAU-GSW1]|uniref:YqhG family protein n=1 Tax=Paenibacillus sp. NEAU-GSW1 TaxID=2682486 RepID=UPI0012E163CC|nr:YqhG family protein [Paenibacillus sp. NEAU-GSW1]MUT66245.1 hypothetical protein [Paenibacillus sp. NEAU-GSW1]
MNEKQVHKFVHRYLEATQCSIIEKSPAHITVKLSPSADRELTNRPYYWSFVDRTGEPPETMTFLFVTDTQKYDMITAAKSSSQTERNEAASPEEAAANAALGRTLGFVPNHFTANVRLPREDLYFGSRRLEQLFTAARTSGSYVNLFQEPDRRANNPFQSTPYTAWLGVNMRVEFACDMKREEIYSYGISLATGHLVEHFQDRLQEIKLTPRLPSNVHVTKNGLTLARALNIIEQSLERKLKGYDYSWAVGAAARLDEELLRIKSYYEPLIQSATEETKSAVEEQYRQRQAEIKWQYEPRVTASAINCGIFHLEGID